MVETELAALWRNDWAVEAQDWRVADQLGGSPADWEMVAGPLLVVWASVDREEQVLNLLAAEVAGMKVPARSVDVKCVLLRVFLSAKNAALDRKNAQHRWKLVEAAVAAAADATAAGGIDD